MNKSFSARVLFSTFTSALLLLALPAFSAQDSLVEGTAKPADPKNIDAVKLSPPLVKVARLVQAGIDEKVVVSFVKNNPVLKTPSAEELIYLHDLGVPSSVLGAILTPVKKEASMESSQPAGLAPSKPESAVASPTPVPTAPSAPVAPSSNASIAVAASPTVVYTTPQPIYVSPPPVTYYSPYSSFSFGADSGHHFDHHFPSFDHFDGGHHGGSLHGGHH